MVGLSDPRLNRRAERGRDGRAASDPSSRSALDYARHCLEVWAYWYVNQRELGWPRESCEVRAFEASQRATVTDGQAAYHGTATWTDDAGNVHRVRKDPPPAPKETRPQAGPRVPLTDHARLGPQVDRLIREIADTHGERVAQVVRVEALARQRPVYERADHVRVSRRTYYRAWRVGLRALSAMLIRGRRLTRGTDPDT